MRARLLRGLAALVAACATVVLLPTPASAGYSIALASGRRYTLSVEQRGSVGATAPTVILLHGLYNSSSTIATQSAFNHVGTSMGWNVVYGESPTKAWNAGPCCAGAVTAKQDDVQYLVDVVSNLRRRGHFGPVHLAGFSNGGMMALRAGCERPTVFRRVASVAGPLLVPCPAGLAHARHIHGTADTVVRVGGGWSNFCQVQFPSSYDEGGKVLPTADYKLLVVQDLAHAWPPSATPYLRDFFSGTVSTRSVVAGGVAMNG